jgi:hypothetical protein
MGNEALRIADVPFSVTTQIQRAPHWTMIRELTMNAIEAAAKATGEKLVQWTTREIDGVRKAVICNTGPGMDARQLKAATDLACRVEKSLGIDENFGVGAKVSSLASNQCGMRFRSCKNGKVSEVILGYDPDLKQYVRFERQLSGWRRDTVIDVTALAEKEGNSLSVDWTEVALFGNGEDQDTAARPLASMETEKGYIATSLYRRFYRLPPGVAIRLDAPYHRYGAHTRLFVPLGERYDKFAQTESVRFDPRNVTIHFLHDPPIGDRSGLRRSSSGALASSTTTCALIHKNEMYLVMTGNEWSALAPHFGIPFGSKELCVHIELDDDEARPSQYRERLISKDTAEDITPQDYALCVRDVMPEWVKEVIRNASPRKTEDFSDLQRDLQELLNKFKVKVLGRRYDPVNGETTESAKGADVGVVSGSGDGAGGGDRIGGGSRATRRFRQAPEGATATSLYEVFEKPPKFHMLDNSEEIAERGLKGRAALFILETGDLFVNGLYEAVTRTVDDIEPDFAGQADAELIRELVTSAARRQLAFRVGKATVFALAKRANEDWDEQALDMALAKESLSMAADNYLESLAAVRREVKEGIKVSRLQAA